MKKQEQHIVDYMLWCVKCKYGDCKETEDPCNECLSMPINYHSKKPVLFEEED